MPFDTKADSLAPEQIVICHNRVTTVLSDGPCFGQASYPIFGNQRVTCADPGLNGQLAVIASEA